MPIYTRTGDKGTTAVFGGVRVAKDAAQVEAYGNIDELDSFIALAGAAVSDAADKELLLEIQRDLYYIMAMLSGSPVDKTHVENVKNRIAIFERAIDDISAELPKLHSFVLLQGDNTVGILHVCRAVCRRAERRGVSFTKNDLVLQYLNRLSDLLFTLARKYNKGKEVALDRL